MNLEKQVEEQNDTIRIEHEKVLDLEDRIAELEPD